MNKYIYKEVSINELSDYASIPMITTVNSEFIVEAIENGLGGLTLNEVKVNPYIYTHKDESTSWPKEFDVTNWGFFIVYDQGKPIAGMTLVYNTDEINMLAKRKDLTVL